MSQTHYVNDFVDAQQIRSFNIKLLVWSFLAMFADGFDLNSLGFAAPALAELWGVERSAMGSVLSANLVGIFIGAPILGWLGDRYGRRPLIISGILLFGVMTLLMAWTTTKEQMMVLRFIAGIGIGGIMPNTISLNSELSPKRFRSTLIVLMFLGITTGSMAVGLVAQYFMPTLGWQILFHLGGILPIAVAIGLIFTLPESLKFLATRPERQQELLNTARQMRPDLHIKDTDRFLNPPAVGDTTAADMRAQLQHYSTWLRPLLLVWLPFRELFKGGLGLITPLLWVCFCIALMSNFFLNNMIPLIYSQYGIPANEAAVVATWYHAGGIAGGLLISVLLDRMGFSIVALMFALAIPFIALLGMGELPFAALAAISGLAGVTVLGAQFGNNASAGLLYPTAIRARGVGVALSIGRFGSILGPSAGALLLGMDLDLQTVFLVAAAPVLIGLLAAIWLTLLCYRRFNSFLIDDTPVATKEP